MDIKLLLVVLLNGLHMTVTMKPHKFSISDILTRPPNGSDQKRSLDHGKLSSYLMLSTLG